MESFGRPVNYRAIVEQLETAASELRERFDEDRAQRLCQLAAMIREEQRLPLSHPEH